MNRYQYSGQVLDIYGNVLDRNFNSRTIAASDSKAKSNLSWQWKTENKYPRNYKIELTGSLKKIGVIELKGVK